MPTPICYHLHHQTRCLTDLVPRRDEGFRFWGSRGFRFFSSQKKHKTKKRVFETVFTQFLKIKFGLAFHFFKNESATLETELCLSFTSGNRHKQGFASFSHNELSQKQNERRDQYGSARIGHLNRSIAIWEMLVSAQSDPKMCLGGGPKNGKPSEEACH